MQSEGRERREASGGKERKGEREKERKGEGGIRASRAERRTTLEGRERDGERIERAKREQKETGETERKEIEGERQRVSVRTVSGRWLYVRVLDRRPVLFYESQYFTRQLDSRGGHH